ncbi:MAG TPA: PAS domain S-box protein, partial [Janthinobacterium sp.]|nr:PAS domain S-box protein [Janthinobacterium sp.]
MPDLPKTSIPLPHEAAEMFRLMAEEIEEAAIFLMDTQGIITVWNKAAQTIKGYSAEEAVGQFFGVLYTDDDQARGWPNHNLGLAQAHGYYSEENWRKKKDGSLFWARAALTALRDPQGLLLGFSKVTLDLTRHKQLEECLDEKEETRRIMQAAKAGTWKWNALNQELALSPPLLALLGYDQDELAPNFSAWTRLVHPPDLPGMLKKLQTVLDRRPNVPLASDVRLRSKDGACRWFYLRADWHRSSIDQSFMLMGVCVDINDVKVLAEERERLFRQLQAEKERAQVTLAAITNGVITTTLNGAVDSMNTAAERLTGWSRAEALGRALAEIFHIADETTLAPLPDPVAQCLHENRAIVASTHAVLMDRNGQRHAIEYSAAPLHLQGNRPDGAVLVIHDVAEARGLLQNLRYQASHDVLTGLINRREFSVRLQRTLDRNRQLEALPGALLYLDLDQFKIVNDTCGHAAGDDLLRQLSLAYGAHVRERDTL